MHDSPSPWSALSQTLWTVVVILGFALLMAWLSRSDQRAQLGGLQSMGQRAVGWAERNTGSRQDVDGNPHTRGYQGLSAQDIGGASPHVIVARHRDEVCVGVQGAYIVLKDPHRDDLRVYDGNCPFAPPQGRFAQMRH
jgi:hypothetical protein